MQDTTPSLPRALARDGWWLDDAPIPARHPVQSGQRLPGALLLSALVLASDLLFWGHGFGLNLAIFAVLVAGAATHGLPVRRLFWPMVLMLAGILPVVEFVQPLSLMFMAGAVLAALALAHNPDLSPVQIVWTTLARLSRLPADWIRQALPARLRAFLTETELPPAKSPAHLRALWRNWAFPLGGALVFGSLLIDANPVFSDSLSRVFDLGELVPRVMFWAGIALFTAPLLRPVAAVGQPDLPRLALPGLGLNPGSTLRALSVFNLMIGLQTLSDVTILIGGASLPEGMSYAEYAHRGAYPLLATALLAGTFALLARPFLDEHRALKPLMLLWLAQNVALCASAALRLDLYIDSYGLTYLRIHALIWMGLTACVLMLIGWQVIRRRPNAWLAIRGAMLGVATLYACAFVNFAEEIAERNLTRAEPDLAYICRLGPMAYGPISAARTAERRLCPDLVAPTQGAWQEWGLRKARVQAYGAAATTEDRDENPARR